MRNVSQAMIGKEASVAMPNSGSIDSNTAAVPTIISTSVAKSIRLSERKLQIRSVSLLMRATRSPVRLVAKKSSDSRCKCAYVALRKSALTRSLSQASTQPWAQLSPQARIAAPAIAATYKKAV